MDETDQARSPSLALRDIRAGLGSNDTAGVGFELADAVFVFAELPAVAFGDARVRAVELLESSASGLAAREHARVGRHDAGVDEDGGCRARLFGATGEAETGDEEGERGAHLVADRDAFSRRKPFESRRRRRFDVRGAHGTTATLRVKTRPGRLDFDGARDSSPRALSSKKREFHGERANPRSAGRRR